MASSTGDVNAVIGAQLVSDLRVFTKQLPPGLKRLITSTARNLVEKSRAQVPVDTGDLASSVTYLDDQPDGFGIAMGTGDSEVYARWVEYGGGDREGGYIPEGRYIGPTVLGAQELIVTAMTNAVQENITSFDWSTIYAQVNQ